MKGTFVHECMHMALKNISTAKKVTVTATTKKSHKFELRNKREFIVRYYGKKWSRKEYAWRLNYGRHTTERRKNFNWRS